jgi:hypothetical protein
MELVPHVIQASNVLLGPSRFFTLKLPAAWNLAPGVGHPEIMASHERRRVRWVASGSFWYVLFDGERRWAMEFACHIRPISNRPLTTGTESTSVGGHPAQIRWRTARRGLFKRHDVRFMTLEHDCPQSERRLTLEFSGWCPEEGFREVLDALQALECH